MTKFIIILVIISVFLMGLKLGDDSFNQNLLFEKEKEQFEQQITSPNNNYQNKELTPKKNVVSKTAEKIDNVIEQMVEKFKDLLKKL